MFIVNRSANQSYKKRNYKRGEEVEPILENLEICLVCRLNSQINITWMVVQHRLGGKSNFGCKKNQTIVFKSKDIVLYIFAILVRTKLVWVICNTYNLHQTRGPLKKALQKILNMNFLQIAHPPLPTPSPLNQIPHLMMENHLNCIFVGFFEQ